MKDRSIDMKLKPGDPGLENCNGCAVCTLSCPVWRQTHDLMMTFCGRARSAQGGRDREALRASAEACVLCASCQPSCSYGMDTLGRTLELRAAVMEAGTPSPAMRKRLGTKVRGRVLLANSLIQKSSERPGAILSAIGRGIAQFSDNGEDIADAIEAGAVVPEESVGAFVSSLSLAGEIITTEGLIYRLLKLRLPGVRVLGLGEALIKYAGLSERLKKGDLYIIDARTYNAGHESVVGLYDQLRHKTGAMMNLDLQRVATPTGARRKGLPTVVDPAGQARWILEGRPAKRIIVERVEDIDVFKKAAGVPVIFVSELY